MAQRFVGIHETGNNRGEPAKLFMLPYGYQQGTMWCGLFIHHVFTTAKVAHGVKGAALAANWSIPSTAIQWRWGHEVAGRRPASGDIALFRFGGSRISHVEIVINWPDEDEDYFWVIGGNTSNPNNSRQEGVYAKQRPKSQALIVNRIDLFN